tara:strand:- start:1499 stop:2407 length:909 start_codon:yes stop_codon:yes gene_type:complete
MNSCQGWLNIYKPKGYSSFAVVRKIKNKFSIDKIGHGGTLDPLAEGVLPIAIGKATKLIPFINSNIKEYEFEIKWGEQTTTDDSEGKIIERSSKIPSNSDIKKALNNFIGETFQKPPKASAVKINGIRAYKLLRENKEFETKPKKVFIRSLKILNLKKKLLTKIAIQCSKGFYIRSFARDIAEKLNTKAHIYSLKRTKVGKFNLNNANLLDDVIKIRQTLSEFNGFHSSISMLDDILAYEIREENVKYCISQGKMIKINSDQLFDPPFNSSDGKVVFLTEKGNVISFGKLDGDLFKPEKVLI